ncbi:MAG: hypothetical protein O7G30_07685 [Proteobacteria bacterium]|nr:hypothetical protein [Pseudomonadota bacterium]
MKRNVYPLPRHSVLAVLALLAFMGVASGLRAWVPWSESSDLAARVRYFAAHRDEFEVLFFGSSQVRRSLAPAVIDAELQRRGHPLRSFSFGTEGMNGYEADALLEDVLDMRPRRLTWVFVELRYWHLDGVADPRNHFTDRMVHWHTLRQTAAVLRSLGGRTEPLAHRIWRGWVHLQHGFWHFTSLGQGARSLSVRVDPPVPAQRIAAERGFASLDEWPSPHAEEARSRFLHALDPYRQRVARLSRFRGGAVHSELTDRIDLDFLRSQAQRVRAAGAELVYFVTAIPDAAPELRELERSGSLPAPLLSFNSPARHPELYRVDHRYDGDHLNRRGAEVMSRAFAARFARMLEDPPGR